MQSAADLSIAGYTVVTGVWSVVRLARERRHYIDQQTAAEASKPSHGEAEAALARW